MRPIEVVSSITIAVKREDVWRFIADTDRLNKAAGLPPVRFIPDPDRRKKGFYRASIRLFGVALQYEEEPFEWVRGEWYEVKRRFRSGPIASLRGGVRLSDTDGGTTISVVATITPRQAWGAILGKALLKWKATADVVRVLKRFEAACADGAGDGTNAAREVNRPALEAGIARLRRASVPETFCDALLRAIASGSDVDVARIRPFEFADRHRMGRIDALRHFLESVPAGVVDLFWSALCPNCRAPSLEDRDLGRFAEAAHCDTCDITFGTDLAGSMEAVFRPHPSIRPTAAGRYCIGGPANAREVVTQLRLAPGTDRDAAVSLSPGRYHIRVYPQVSSGMVSIGDAGAGEMRVHVDEESITVSPAAVAAGPVTIRTTNRSPREALLNVERETWLESAATAARVIALQTFRDLFPSVVVPAGCELSVSSITLLFTDLKDSTALYQSSGDAAAFAFVQRHFQYLAECAGRHGGGVVKTIGDAVMAAFTGPDEAVRSALAMQRGWAAFVEGERLARPTALKIGIHAGRCFAINAGGRLDYFGSMVNEAARIQGEAGGGEITLLSALFDDPKVSAALAGEPITWVRRTAVLKGLDRERELVAFKSVG